MSLFILILISLALVISFLKFALLPRLWGIGLAGFSLLSVFFFNSKIATTGKDELMNDFTSMEALRNWCALLVIQELIVCVAGVSYFKSISEAKKSSYFGYLAFSPSLLLPIGIWYLKLLGFNFLLERSFTQVCIMLALVVVVSGIGVSELARHVFREKGELFEFLARFEFFYILLGIFLPVAAQARFQPTAPSGASIMDGLVLTFVLSLIVLFIASIINIYKTRKNQNEFYHTNS